MNGFQRILVFCLPGIGDALLFTPAFRAIKDALPDAHVTALVMFRGTAQILERNPHVDEIVHHDFVGASRWQTLRFVLGLRRRRFDVTILGYPANRFGYNAVAWLIGSPVRIGHRYLHLDLVNGNFLNTRSVREDDSLTNIQENLRLVSLLTRDECTDLRVEFEVMPEMKAYAGQWLEARGLAGQCLIGFHPGGSTFKNHVHKRWPPSSFVELGRRLHTDTGARVLVFGGPEEGPLVTEVARSIGPAALSVTGTDLLETCALMQRCAHFVSNDSALLHLAGAMHVPTTAIFGPTSAEWVRIPGVPRIEVRKGLPCQPCFYYSPRDVQCAFGDFRCLHELSVDEVARKVSAVMQDSRGLMNVAPLEGVRS